MEEAAVLLDRHVKIVDEVSEVIAERGGSPSWVTHESIVKSIPAGLRWQEREAAIHRATEEALRRFRTEIEAPAEAILRERKASRPSAVAKVAVPFAGDGDYYREALDGVEPVFPDLSAPPGITSMALRVSWPRASALRGFPPGAFVSSAHRGVLALYVGPYRPGHDDRGFYLVQDAGAAANSVAVVPRIPTRGCGACVTMFSHCSMGAGVNVLRTGRGEEEEFLLAELLLRKDDDTGRTSNKATLFRWRSSSASADGWVQTEVVLPLPSEPAADDDASSEEEVTYNFYVDTMFAVGSSCLCWADLLQGVLLCDDALADHPAFRFIPLPDGCSIKVDPWKDRGLPDRYRSMSCVDRGTDHDQTTITFVSMDGLAQGRHISNVDLATWTLRNPTDATATWTKGAATFRVRDLWSDPFYKDDLLLGPLTPTCPLLSMTRDDVVYVAVDQNRLQFVEGFGMESLIERHILCLDLQNRRVLSAFKSPPGARVTPHLSVMPTKFTMYRSKRDDELNKKQGKCVILTPSSRVPPTPPLRSSVIGPSGNVGLASLLTDLDLSSPPSSP
ncbi:hypothetical protein EJB05_47698, partial [Eragrostis curvula]